MFVFIHPGAIPRISHRRIGGGGSAAGGLNQISSIAGFWVILLNPRGSVAQRLEQGTHNSLVLGSNPSVPIRMELLLIRHGQSLANVGLSSEADCLLSDHGHTQAKHAAESLRARDLTGYIGLVSPYQRAIQTAQYLTAETSLAFGVDPRLREYGKTTTISGQCFPQETVEQLIDRISDFAKWALGKRLVIATTGVCRAEGNFWERVPNCGLWHIRDQILTDWTAGGPSPG
jgi:phosphohistidine phosphatase SixA